MDKQPFWLESVYRGNAEVQVVVKMSAREAEQATGRAASTRFGTMTGLFCHLEAEALVARAAELFGLPNAKIACRSVGLDSYGRYVLTYRCTEA